MKENMVLIPYSSDNWAKVSGQSRMLTRKREEGRGKNTLCNRCNNMHRLVMTGMRRVRLSCWGKSDEAERGGRVWPHRNLWSMLTLLYSDPNYKGKSLKGFKLGEQWRWGNRIGRLKIKWAAFCDGCEGDWREVPRKTCLMDRWWCHSLRWGTMAEDLCLEVTITSLISDTLSVRSC